MDKSAAGQQDADGGSYDGNGVDVGGGSIDDAPSDGESYCLTSWGFRPRAGQEAFAISQLFAMFTATLCVLALVTLTLHTFLEGTLTLLTVSAFELGAAGMFGLLAVFIFLGYYKEIKSDQHSIGPAFYLLVLGSSLCVAAGGLSAWTAIKGGYYLWGIGKQETEGGELMAGPSDGGFRRGSREVLDYGDIKIVKSDENDVGAAQARLEPVVFHSKENLMNDSH
ncbi:hypothetical protein ElyMa_004415900 [Elysia marginata]|uniref:MARVEL domain-containing protein n=1 Tax=Elysia marginata TaxID=1093978 RepID=A0AAV4HAC4_9GAST|nr:hypothetical protein ElyMa_004415900 [Elysia marginata]